MMNESMEEALNLMNEAQAVIDATLKAYISEMGPMPAGMLYVLQDLIERACVLLDKGDLDRAE